jgi:serine phosphatase RsbU (regulator of sigma subunit)
MKLFQKSLLGRVIVYFLLFGILLSAVIFYFYSNGQNTISLEVFAAALFIFLLYFLLVYLYEIVRPFEIILAQIKNLLTGRRYNRIYTKRIDEIGTIAHFFNEVTKNLEKISSQLREGKRMLGELEVAAQIQKDILPTESPRVPGLDIIAKTRSAVELGGDNFDFITEKDNTYIYIGDVTGHGVPAALVMTIVHTLIHTFVEMYDKAFDVVYQTNRRLKTRIKSTMFMTMLMLRWNATTQKMTYVGAGHEHLLIYRAATGQCEVKMSGGIALGMVADNSRIIKEVDLPLAIGDVIILYTDGIVEARNMAGEMYTLDRLKKSVELYAPQYGSEGIVYHVARDFSRYVEQHVQEDDITLIAIRYVGEGPRVETLTQKLTAWSDEEKDPAQKSSAAEKKQEPAPQSST